MRTWMSAGAVTALLPALASAQETPDAGGGTDLGDSLGLMAKWLDQGRTWVEEEGPGVIVKAITFVVLLIAFRILATILGKVVSKTLSTSRLKVSELLKNFFVNVVSKATFLAGILIALAAIHVPIGPLLAGVGVLGFVVGFALQDTLSNFASGIMILLYRPYDIGDVVSAAGVTGKVTAMNLVSTTFLTPDNQMQVVPNKSIWGSVITNVTANPTRRVDLTIGVGYGDDLDRAEQVLREVASSHPLVLADPAPVIKVGSLGDSSVNFLVRPWCKTSDYWDVYWDLTKSIKQRIDQEGLNIPFPQRDIHIVSHVGNGPVAGRA